MRSARRLVAIVLAVLALTASVATPLVVLWMHAYDPVSRGGAFVQRVPTDPPAPGGVLVLYRVSSPPRSVIELANPATPRLDEATTTLAAGLTSPIAKAADTAWVVANEITGSPVTHTSRLVVARVEPGSPADLAGIDPQDTVVPAPPGRPPRLVDTAAGPVPLADGASLSNVVALSEPRPELTVTPRLHGSSAGLANALVFVDHLTEGSLTAGRLVAATGVVDTAGRVSAIGSLEYKTQAALAAGADVLFVEPSQIRVASDAAAAYRPDAPLTIVGVATVRAAVLWLCASGGTAAGVCQ